MSVAQFKKVMTELAIVILMTVVRVIKVVTLVEVVALVNVVTIGLQWNFCRWARRPGHRSLGRRLWIRPRSTGEHSASLLKPSVARIFARDDYRQASVPGGRLPTDNDYSFLAIILYQAIILY